MNFYRVTDFVGQSDINNETVIDTYKAEMSA